MSALTYNSTLGSPSLPSSELGMRSADEGTTTEQHPSILLWMLRDAAWLPQVYRRLEELASLRPNWDSRGGRPISSVDVVAALTFLGHVMHDHTQAPSITPLTSGGLELHWRVGNVDVEAVFDAARHENTLIVKVGEREWEEPIHSAGSLFGSVVDRLIESSGAAPVR